MTATLDGVTNKRKDKPEPATEQQVAEELVRRAREQGLSLTGPDGLLKQLTKTVLETALNQEMTEYPGMRSTVSLWRRACAMAPGPKRRLARSVPARRHGTGIREVQKAGSHAYLALTSTGSSGWLLRSRPAAATAIACLHGQDQQTLRPSLFRRIRSVAARCWVWPDGPSSCTNHGWLSPDVA